MDLGVTLLKISLIENNPKQVHSESYSGLISEAYSQENVINVSLLNIYC